MSQNFFRSCIKLTPFAGTYVHRVVLTKGVSLILNCFCHLETVHRPTTQGRVVPKPDFTTYASTNTQAFKKVRARPEPIVFRPDPALLRPVAILSNDSGAVVDKKTKLDVYGCGWPFQGRYKFRSHKPKHEKTPMSRLSVVSLEFALGLPVTSLEVQRQSHKYWHQCFFMLGLAGPILIAAFDHSKVLLLWTIPGANPTYNFELQRQRCKNLHRHG
jgi:hypothetical protein